MLTTLFAFASLTTSTLALTSGNIYSISPKAFPDLCIAPSANSEGSNLVVVECDGSDDIGWKYDGTTNMFSNTAFQKCIDVTDGGKWSGNHMQVWGCYTDQPNQRFTINTNGNLMQWKDTTFCLDLTDGKGQVGNVIQIWSCSSANPNQQWIFGDVEEVDGECGVSNAGNLVAQPSAAATSMASVAASASSVAYTDLPYCDEIEDGIPVTTVSSSGVIATSTIGGNLYAGNSKSASATQTAGAASNSTSSGGASAASASATASSSGKKGHGNASASGTASAAAASASSNSTSGSSGTGTVSASSNSGILQAKGGKVYDTSGNEVILKGTNIGGWLVWEDWMCGMSDSSGNADRFAQWTLESRFGADQTLQLLNAWQDSWMTSDDWDKIKAMGFNVVRLPFSYRQFQDANGNWLNNGQEFTKLDWAMAQAKQRGIYVIPTFHIWQGQKEGYSTISENSDQGQQQRNAGAAIWQKVAAHYMGETIIAAYDAINEPTGSWGDLLQQDLYKAIRSVDSNRIIILESISTPPSNYGWTQVMYSDHEYLMMTNDYNTNIANYGGMGGDISNWQSQQIPIYIGEFMAMDNTLPWLLNQLNQAGVWWSAWAYKTVNMGGWGLYNTGSMSVDVNTASFNDLLSQWSNMPGLNQNTDIYQTYVNAAAGKNLRKRNDESIVSSPAKRTARADRIAHRRSRRHPKAHVQGGTSW